jgi:hypothetical protein
MPLIANWLRRLILNLLLSDESALTSLSAVLLPHIAEQLLERASKYFDVRIVNTVVPQVGNQYKYNVYECDKLATHWFFIDLSEARQGDRFEMYLYFQVAGEFRLHEFHAVEDELVQPIVTLPGRFAPGIRLELVQTRGLSKPVRVEILGRYEEAL